MKTATQDCVLGNCSSIAKARELAVQFAPTAVPVLMVGATGTGKDLFARFIHGISGRDGEFVDVNCGALPNDLADSLLFGHRRGAFTGALDAAAGLIEAAGGGTLFLDELESLPIGAQVKLLRVLESGEVRRLGEANKRSVDFRIVASTKEDLGTRINTGVFRRDLFQRVAGMVIELPSLCERDADILLLAESFASECGQHLGDGAAVILGNYSWPGNVRELRSAIERATFLANGNGITGPVMAEAIALGTPPKFANVTNTQNPVEESDANRRTVLNALNANGWSAGRTAAALGISRTTLFRRLKKIGLSLKSGTAKQK